MVQQMAIYEQGCRLIVSVPPLCPDEGSNLSTGRRSETYSAFDDRLLT